MKSSPVISKKKATVTGIPKDKSFSIVAIGASAGGLEAVKELLQNLPSDTGMSFIYVQHLSPDHKSMLSSLLSKSTEMTVKEVTNKVFMKPNHLYVIPPDKEMLVLDGHIKLMPRRKDKVINLPIDTFFISLAEKHAEGAIGIILSGNASDGSKGIAAIKLAGGITFAQDSSAKFNGMPTSAIATGAVDFILSPKSIAAELCRISKEVPVQNIRSLKGKEEDLANNNPDLKTILQLLLKETGVDFSHYKMATIKRRILRRMLLYKIKSLPEYAKLVAKKTEDINILYQDLLINVTTFFRDTAAHEYLKKTLLPKLIKGKGLGETLRIWIPACSSGEEAYSIAIAILEIQGARVGHTDVKIFATDLSVQALNRARIGEYTLSELSEVSPQRLARFYVKTGTKYRISKEVHDMCVFAQHNVLKDPPFSKVDLISCCNLLIYLDTAAQKRVFSTFHYALNENGYLVLGKSESAGISSQLFSAVNKKVKIYSRKKRSGTRALPQLLPRTIPNNLPQKNINPLSIKQPSFSNNHFGNAVDNVLLLKFMPASVVINHSMEILQFRGDTDHYLKHASGKASLNILKMTAPEIAFELRAAISKTIKSKLPVHKTGIEIKNDTSLRLVNIEVFPINIEWEEPLLFIVFTEPEAAQSFQPTGNRNSSAAKDRRIKKLEDDLLATRADMQLFAVEQESFNEVLQSANEEIVSSNEELQSVNEELETSKEEIESANEELITTNQELQTRNDLLNESYDYSESIIATLHEPMIILDKDLRVRSANRSFYKGFKVKEEETEGTLLYDLGNKQWNIPVLRKLLEDIINKNTNFNNFEVTHSFPGVGKKIMLLNARRIVQKKHDMQLILLAIHDVTELRNKTLELASKEKVLLEKDASEHAKENARLEKAVLQRTKELGDANKELILQNNEKEKREAALILANNELALQYRAKEKWEGELMKANIELAFQNAEKEKRAAELVIANVELASSNIEKQKRADELVIANEELAISNIEKQKRADELVIANIELELSNIEKQKRSDELIIANEELAFQNEEKEKRANELISTNKELEAFAYVSSHDLQEPLRKIQTFATRILSQENENLSVTGKDYFRRMQNAAARMRVLIDDLLAYSRTNITDRKYEKINLGLILDEVKEELKESIKEKNAVIDAKNMCECEVIVFQFRQLMHNLLSNALKFSSPLRPLNIIIRSSHIKGSASGFESLLPAVKYCHIKITDNGIGFDPKYKDRIFEVFQKLHGKEEYEGTGIGLAIVKKIVENHHGIIRATGVLGEGSTFDIFVPVKL